MILWSLTIAISIALLAFTAGERNGNITMAYVNMAIAVVSGVIFVVLALRSNRQLQASGASAMAIGADTARSMGLIYLWGTLGLAVIYGFGFLIWKEWWHFLLAFLTVSIVCFIISLLMQRRVDANQEDPQLLKHGDRGNMLQLVGMIIVMLGLLIDGKMIRFIVERYTDWAANNIFFFGAAALTVISAYALMTRKNMQEQDKSDEGVAS